MIKVADFIEEAQVGGPQIRMVNFAYYLNNKVHTKIIIPKKNSSGFVNLCEKYKLDYKLLTINKISKNKFLAFKYIIFFFYEIFILIHYFSKEKFDIVHVSGGAWQIKAIIAAKLCGIPSIWHINDTYMPLIIKKIFYFFSSFPKAYIFASEKSKDYYSELINKKIPFYVVPATVDTKKFSPEIFPFLKNNKNIQEKITIGTVANISPVKGLEKIIELSSCLNPDAYNIEFLIIGRVLSTQKNYYKKLKNLIKLKKINNIFFIDFVEDVRPMLHKIDIYLCTSLSESSPISVWEAMSMQKALVSSNVGDVPKYIKNGYNGIIVNNNDIVELKSAIKLLINDSQKRLKYGVNARQTCISNLETSVCANDQLNIYKQIINQ